MEEIILKEIVKKENTIKYNFSVSEGLQHFFSGKPFSIEYPENIESVPDSVAAIPFVSNVLPLIWLTNSTLRLEELDKDFYDCLPSVRGGYEKMFPESTFSGNIAVNKIVYCNEKSAKGSVALFSGGLDAVQTLISHIDEKPHLISIWGADIKYANSEGWEVMLRGIEEASQKFGLAVSVIRSSFRDFDEEWILHQHFYEQLKDGWWHGVKHGIALISHAAPYAYLNGLNTVYIASSNCAADGHVRCASNPLIDNEVRFSGVEVIHDGFNFNRQDKIHNIVEYVKKTGKSVSVHVCWETQNGNNCCQCEKCYRTMAGLLVEGADPADYGFEKARETLPYMHAYIIGQCSRYSAIPNHWSHIKNRLLLNKELLIKKPFWKDIQWIEKSDFLHPETLKLPLNLRIRSKLSEFKFYNKLHNIKAKILNN